MNLIQPFHACTWTTRKRKRLALGAIFIVKFHQCNQPHKNFLLHSFTCIPQIFVPNLPKWSKPIASKLRTLGPSKNSSRVSSIPFVGNPHFSMFVHGVRYRKNCVSKIAGHHFPGELKTRN